MSTMWAVRLRIGADISDDPSQDLSLKPLREIMKREEGRSVENSPAEEAEILQRSLKRPI